MSKKSNNKRQLPLTKSNSRDDRPYKQRKLKFVHPTPGKSGLASNAGATPRPSKDAKAKTAALNPDNQPSIPVPRQQTLFEQRKHAESSHQSSLPLSQQRSYKSHDQRIESLSARLDEIDRERNHIQSTLASLDSKSSHHRQKKSKIYRDPIHRDIVLHPLLVEIIDTKGFQRLRNLMQLGAASHVFSGAVHNRFQHSIGVAHLAGTLLRQLRQTQPALNITDRDILVVEVAGLCHDLGHGPLSHVFDGEFIPKIDPNSTFAHEEASLSMFEHILSHHGIDITKYGLDDTDIAFIKEAIIGTPRHERKGRPHVKSFLYDIVNNTKSGLDVDKLDYFERDSVFAGLNKAFEFGRLLKTARVLPCMEGTDEEPIEVMRICYPLKSIRQVFSLFQTRYLLHEKLYTHRVVKACELMMTDVLLLAEPYIKLRGANDELVSMSQSVNDMYAFETLDDHIMSIIKHSTDPGLVPAQKLLACIEQRKLYRCVGRSLMAAHDCTALAECPGWCGLSTRDIEAQMMEHAAVYFEEAELQQYRRKDSEFLPIVGTPIKSQTSSSAYEFALPQSAPSSRPGSVQSSPVVKKSTSSSQIDSNNTSISSSAGSVKNNNNNSSSSADSWTDLGDVTLSQDSTSFQPALSQLSQASFYSQPESDRMTDFDGMEPTTPRKEGKHTRRVQLRALKRDDFCVDFQKIHHGKKSTNPIEHVGFYAKDDIDSGRYVDLKRYTHMFPPAFQQRFVRVFCKEQSMYDVVRFAFERWCCNTLAHHNVNHSLTMNDMAAQY